MSFDFSTLVTDRTQADVAYAQALAKKISSGTATEAELAEWNAAALKGSYNASDLNRVGAAMQCVADRLTAFGYAADIAPKADWLETDAPRQSDMEAYLFQLIVLRNAFAVMQSTPSVPPDMENLTVAEANNIEKILEDIDFMLTQSSKAWYCSGEVFSGEV